MTGVAAVTANDAVTAGQRELSAGEQVVMDAFRVARVLGSADRTIGGPPRAWLLRQLALTPGIRVADLADGCGLDASTASRHVRTLEDAGLLTRSGDPDDRRATSLSLTSAGRETLEAGLRVRADLVHRATAYWSDTDREQLAVLLSRLAEDVGLAATSDQH